MNYAAAFLVLILGASTIYWYISGRKFYNGPIIEAQGEDERPESTSDSSERKQEKFEV